MAFESSLKQHAPKGIVVADYGKGVMTNSLILAARQAGVPCYVDCKPQRMLAYAQGPRGFFLKPNAKEFMGTIVDNKVDEMGSYFAYGVNELLVTRGEEGMNLVVFNSDGEHHEQTYLPPLAKAVYNTTGAGDTALAVFAWCRAGGMAAVTSAAASNVAASIVVTKRETGSVSRMELRNAVENCLLI